MAIVTLQAQSLLPNRHSYQLNFARDQELGAGGQGTVYAVMGSNQVVKLYSDPAVKEHLVSFVGHLQLQRLRQQSVSLQGLPQDVFVSSDGQLGVLMGRVPGQSLSRLGYATLRNHDLPRSLALAASLVQGVACLHRTGVVVADLADANTMVDVNLNQTFIIDIEGGGIQERSGRKNKEYRLSPLVWGHDQGSLLAPELRQRKGKPHLDSDAWSLAGLLHRLLIRPAGADAFFWGRDPRVVENALPWPPPVESQPANLHRLLLRHRVELAHLGPRLYRNFQHTFGRMGRSHPEHRISAERWLRDLTTARQWVHQCRGCHQLFVGEQVAHCPHCRTPVLHARLMGGRRMLSLKRNGLSLSRSQLGLGCTKDAVLRWRRAHSELLVEMLAHDCRLTGAQLVNGSANYHSYRILPGRSCLRIDNAQGASVSLLVDNPSGAWPDPSLSEGISP